MFQSSLQAHFRNYKITSQEQTGIYSFVKGIFTFTQGSTNNFADYSVELVLSPAQPGREYVAVENGTIKCGQEVWDCLRYMKCQNPYICLRRGNGAPPSIILDALTFKLVYAGQQERDDIENYLEDAKNELVKILSTTQFPMYWSYIRDIVYPKQEIDTCNGSGARHSSSVLHQATCPTCGNSRIVALTAQEKHWHCHGCGREGWGRSTDDGVDVTWQQGEPPAIAQLEEIEAARKLLGLEAHATEAEIKAAYRKAARLWHPDRHAMHDAVQQAEASRRMMELNLAYSTLSSNLESKL